MKRIYKFIGEIIYLKEVVRVYKIKWKERGELEVIEKIT